MALIPGAGSAANAGPLEMGCALVGWLNDVTPRNFRVTKKRPGFASAAMNGLKPGRKAGASIFSAQAA
jgi:hypothetical protein